MDEGHEDEPGDARSGDDPVPRADGGGEDHALRARLSDLVERLERAEAQRSALRGEVSALGAEFLALRSAVEIVDPVQGEAPAGTGATAAPPPSEESVAPVAPPSRAGRALAPPRGAAAARSAGSDPTLLPERLRPRATAPAAAEPPAPAEPAASELPALEDVLAPPAPAQDEVPAPEDVQAPRDELPAIEDVLAPPAATPAPDEHDELPSLDDLLAPPAPAPGGEHAGTPPAAVAPEEFDDLPSLEDLLAPPAAARDAWAWSSAALADDGEAGPSDLDAEDALHGEARWLPEPYTAPSSSGEDEHIAGLLSVPTAAATAEDEEEEDLDAEAPEVVEESVAAVDRDEVDPYAEVPQAPTMTLVDHLLALEFSVYEDVPHQTEWRDEEIEAPLGLAVVEAWEEELGEPAPEWAREHDADAGSEASPAWAGGVPFGAASVGAADEPAPQVVSDAGDVESVQAPAWTPLEEPEPGAPAWAEPPPAPAAAADHWTGVSDESVETAPPAPAAWTEPTEPEPATAHWPEPAPPAPAPAPPADDWTAAAQAEPVEPEPVARWPEPAEPEPEPEPAAVAEWNPPPAPPAPATGSTRPAVSPSGGAVAPWRETARDRPDPYDVAAAVAQASSRSAPPAPDEAEAEEVPPVDEPAEVDQGSPPEHEDDVEMPPWERRPPHDDEFFIRRGGRRGRS